MKKEIKAKHAMAALALLGLLGTVPGAQAAEWKTGETHNVGTGTTDENITFQEQFTLSGGTVNFGSTNDKAGTITSADKVTISGGTITVSGSGTKVSGAIMMKPSNDKIPEVVGGVGNKYIDNPDSTLIPPVHSINAGSSMTIDRVDINIGAPRYTTTPTQADIAKSWEGLRLDLKSAKNMTINGGDFRVANIVFPIKKEDKAALRFESGGTLTVNGGTFTAQGQPMGNPGRKNYDVPSLFSMKAKDNLVIKDGTFVIESARFHMGSTDGKVIIDGGTFNINSKSPYPGWTTFDVVGTPPNTSAVERPKNGNTQDAMDKFGSLDTGGSLLVVNGGTFNLGTKGETTANYINMADKEAVINGGTFNIYTNSNFGNNKAGTVINGGTFNLIDGGYFGGRNTNGASVAITNGEINVIGSAGSFGSISASTEKNYLNDDRYNKTTVDISGGKFTFTGTNASKLETGSILASYGVNISGGEFIRKQDGLNAITVSFSALGQTGSAAATSGDLNISGGTFRTSVAPANYVRDKNVVISRDDNITLYDKTLDPGQAKYKLHTEASVNTLFDTGNEAAIKAAFAPANNKDYLPTRNEVLTALKVAQDTATSYKQLAWSFDAAKNINITGGNFDLTSLNASKFKAGNTFNFANAQLIAGGGGGEVTINAKNGINIASGRIAIYGSDEKGVLAAQYDDRGKLDRDRWTLGKYLGFETDGDIVLGAKGTAGPDIYLQDGLLYLRDAAATPNAPALGKMYIYSGSLTLNGITRSTLNGGSVAETVIDGGTLNVLTADAINRNEVDSASMWAVPTHIKSGTVNFYNAQFAGAYVVMDDGVINAMGDSAINGSSHVRLHGGTVNLGNKAYIGAIKGDSLALSPYVSSTKDIELGDKLTVNMDVSKPASGTALTVGKNIGGIYAIANDKTTGAPLPTSITIADGTKFNITNPLALDAGIYTATSLVEAQNGTVTMKDRTFDSRFYGYTLNKVGANSADMVLTVKNPANAIAQLSGNSNIRDNAAGFGEILRNAKGNWLNVVDTVAHGSDAEAAEVLRQVGGENTTATTQSLVNSVGEYRSRMQSQGKSNISGLSGGDSMSANGYRGWISAMGSWGSQADSDGRTGFDASSSGMALGFDTTFADRYTVGLGLGYAKGFSESKDGLSDANSDTWFVSLYTSLDFNPIVVDADVTYANTQSHINNTINAGGQRFENSGDFGIDSWSASIKGSYVFSFNDNASKIAPYVGIDFLSINQHGYSEEGPLAREFGSDQSTLWTLPVGIKASHQFRGQDWTFTPEIGVGYARDLNEFKPAAHVTIPGVSTTEIKSYGTEMSPDSFRGNAGFSVKYKDSVEFFGMYNLDARDKYTNHSVNVGFSYSF